MDLPAALAAAFAAGLGSSGVVVAILWRKLASVERKLEALNKERVEELRVVLTAISAHKELTDGVGSFVQVVQTLIGILTHEQGVPARTKART